jgi:CRP-like cAMP-binding protein
MSLLLNRDLLKFVPALRMLDLNSIISLMQSLYSRVFLPGEYVFKAGDAGMYLYFIKTGTWQRFG